MGLTTVRVPEGMEELFRQAEEVVSRYFRDRIDDPSRGTIEISGERYVLVRAASLSVEFFALVRSLFGGRDQEADDFARNILFDLAHAIGRSDARNFHTRMNLGDPIARLSAGPVHFAFSGWAFVDIFPESRPAAGDDYCLVYDHPYSFESDAWLRTGGTTRFPVCIMNAGYSSGWCQESFSVDLVASEILCRARGDQACRFVMAHPRRIEEFVAAYRDRSPELAPRMQGYSIPDFFARKRAEEELRRHRDELEQRIRQRTAELESSHRQLRQAQKLEALGRLAGGIAHDFNNTVAIIMARTELVRRRVAGDTFLAGEMRRIEEAAGRAAALTAQLLAFARGQVVERRTIDLAATVTALGRTLVPLIGEHIELDLQVPGGTLAIDADLGQIEQVIMNLVVNARDAMPGGGRLRIEVRGESVTAGRTVTSGPLAAGDYAVLTVVDTGTGMDEDVLSRIFDPFFTTKTAGGGSGLGLSIVYGIVQQGGGGIAVASSPGQGTRFDIYLPRADGAPATAGAGAAATTGGGGGTLLLVEDENELRSALRELLLEEGYRVLEAPGPLEALALLRAEPGPVDVILTDLVMPRMHGRELARQARELRPGVEVLYMSGWDPDASSGPVPASAFLRKPFTPSELLERLRAIKPR